MQSIEECDMWWFRELYAVLTAFADDPENTISQIGGGQISIPEDQAEDLSHFYDCIVGKYPHAVNLPVVQVAAAIESILTRRSRTGEAFDESFWSNIGFRTHDHWSRIRNMARTFLIHSTVPTDG